MKHASHFNDVAAQSRFDTLCRRLSAVPQGRIVVEFLRANAIECVFASDRENAAASAVSVTGVKNGKYMYANPKIILRARDNDDVLLQGLLHETRHMMQHLSGKGNPSAILPLPALKAFYRLQEADAQSFATGVLHELRSVGDIAPWKAAIKTGYGDMCAAFDAAIVAGETPIAARASAFAAWFGNDNRLSYYDRNTEKSQYTFLAYVMAMPTAQRLPDAKGFTAADVLLDADMLTKVDAKILRRNIAKTRGRNFNALVQEARARYVANDNPNANRRFFPKK